MEYAENGIVMDVTPHSVTKSFSDTQCRIIFKQLVAAVSHLHQNGIIHRGRHPWKKKILFRTAYLTSCSLIDIKPQNLLLSNENIVKLIDFGNATVVTDSLAGYNTGTPAFMAPELLKKGTYNAPLPSKNIVSKKKTLLAPRNGSPTSADLWSMGVTLYCFTYGHLPFEKSSLLDLYADIQNKSYV